MIIYNPNKVNTPKDRINYAQTLFDQIPAKFCFITGSFLNKKKYNDIDIFVITRSKKTFKLSDKKVKITIIDFNNLHSLFYHSISKCCLAKNILPNKPLKITIADYWQVINEAVPTILNKKKPSKEIRFLILYTEFFKTGKILDSVKLNKRISAFTNNKSILEYIQNNTPQIINKQRKKSYIKRFFYTWAAQYKDLQKYSAHKFLYKLSHKIINN